jgi:hypothetical protein
VFDKIGTESPHGAIFLDRIAVRHKDRHRHAITARREGDTLAVISPGRRNQSGDARPLALQAVDIDEPAAHLEGAGRRMVLVFNNGRRAEPLRQQRPSVSRRRRHRRADDVVRAFQLPEIKHRCTNGRRHTREGGYPVIAGASA